MGKLNILFLCILLMVSCERLVEDFEIKKPGDKITLNGFALADSIPKFYLTSNLALDDPISFTPITGASIVLYMNGEQADSLHINEDGWYTDEDYRFVAGNEYSVDVSAPGYRSVTAEFFVPAPPEMTVLDTNLLIETYPNCIGCSELYLLEFEMQFMNEPGIDDYYSVEVIENSYCVEDEDHECEDFAINYSGWSFLGSNAPYIEAIRAYDNHYLVRNAGEEAWGLVFYFSDRLLDEGINRLTFRGELNVYEFNKANDNILTLVFRKIDKPMFEYARSKGKNSNAEDNPFIQPVSIYSNVENGLGLVSGSSRSEYSIDLNTIISNIYTSVEYEY